MKLISIHDGHNASAAFFAGNKVVAAIQEERLSRCKNQGGFPEKAISEVLKISGCALKDVDRVVFSGFGVTNRLMRREIMKGYRNKFIAPKGWHLRKTEKMLREMRNIIFPAWKARKREKRRAKKQLQRIQPLFDMKFPREKIDFIEHHRCHAACAYFGQGNMEDKILVLTCDGAGDNLCATVNIGEHGILKRVAEISEDDSVAIIYSFITYLLGFAPLEHEYKLMGMAPYAEGNQHSRQIADYFHTLFSFSKVNSFIWNRANFISSTFAIAPELAEKMKFLRFDNIAAGLQIFIEEFFLQWVQQTIASTGIHKLALSGGLFMNVKLNKRIMELAEVESLFIFPSCGDESNSIGAGFAQYADECRKRKKQVDIPAVENIYWGGSFSDDDVKKTLDSYTFQKQIKVTHLEDIERRCAELIAAGNVVARSKGRMEFGARALGNHTIIADPANWQTVHTINAMIKQRDFWMPFAPSMLAEHADEYIINPKSIKAPYMILSFDTRKEKLERIIAATHPYDGSCRPQIVEKSWNPDYHKLLSYYREMTKNGTVLNTSFNIHGFPIVYTPDDAVDVFDKSGLRYLALENYLLEEVKN